MIERYVLISWLDWERENAQIEEDVRELSREGSLAITLNPSVKSLYRRTTLDDCVEYATDEYWVPVLVVE